MITFFEKLQELLAEHVPFVSVTVVDTQGSAPQNPGAKMLVTAAGLYWGTVGGGKIEMKAIEEAQRLLDDKENAARSKFVQWSLPRDLAMTCGGGIKLYFETYNVSAWNIVVFGAGHVASALIQSLVRLDCRVTCVDPRSQWLEGLPSSPRLHKVQLEDMSQYVPKIPDDAFVLLMTMGHTTDSPILIDILKSGRIPPYLGVIGSRAKSVQLRKDLIAAGLPEEMEKHYYCPVGLSIGTNDPEEIAISVTAQLLQERDKLRRH